MYIYRMDWKSGCVLDSDETATEAGTDTTLFIRSKIPRCPKRAAEWHRKGGGQTLSDMWAAGYFLCLSGGGDIIHMYRG